MSATYNPIIQQNATWEITLTIKNPSVDGGITPGTAFDLTNYTGQCQIKSAVDGSILCTPTVTITNAIGGILKVSTSITQNSALSVTSKANPPKPPHPEYDVLIANADLSRVFKLLKGDVIVESGVTHWTP